MGNENIPATNKTTISLEEYINKISPNGQFKIPDYQRGYVWGQYNKYLVDNNKKDSVSYMLQTLIDGYNNKKEKIFLQGITVWEDENKKDIVIVDGQQRTTFFYLLLKYLNCKKRFVIEYQIRTKSNTFLQNLDTNNNKYEENDNVEYEDEYFFKRTLRIFHDEIKVDDKDKFLEYILEHVYFLYIKIPKPQANLIFTLMNGNKAQMRQEELIKSELLRRTSIKNKYISEIESRSIRSRLAREWDKWLYWWNDENVKTFYKPFSTDERNDYYQLGWLIPLVENKLNVSFEAFRNICFNDIKNNEAKEAKEIFKKMRPVRVDFTHESVNYY